MILFYCDVTSFHQVPLSQLVFLQAKSQKMLTHNHPPMRDVIIEHETGYVSLLTALLTCLFNHLRFLFIHTDNLLVLFILAHLCICIYVSIYVYGGF